MSEVTEPKAAKPKWLPPRAGMGRPRGSKNKFGVTIKEMFLESLDMLGGAEYLAWLGKKNPAAYAGLVGRVLPMQITGSDGGPVMVITGVIRADDVEQIEHESSPPTIEGKTLPTETVPELAPAVQRAPYMPPPHATAAPEPPQPLSEPVQSVRRNLGAPWS
jgi:hypothetical protein